MSHLEIPGFVPEFISVLIESRLSIKPWKRPSFNDISEALKENDFRIADRIDSDEASAFASLIESSETWIMWKNCIRMLYLWFVNSAILHELIAQGASANNALRSAAALKCDAKHYLRKTQLTMLRSAACTSRTASRSSRRLPCIRPVTAEDCQILERVLSEDEKRIRFSSWQCGCVWFGGPKAEENCREMYDDRRRERGWTS
jgi:hypothetical protein